MNKETLETIEETFIHSTKSPAQDKIKRARVYKELIQLSGLSVRAYAMKHNIPKSTLEDWLLWNKVDNDKLSELKQTGMTETMIYRGLRDSKESKEVHELDLKIEDLIYELNCVNVVKKISKDTYLNLDMLKKAVESARFRIERAK